MSKKNKNRHVQPRVTPTTLHNPPQQLGNVVVQQSFSGPLPHPDILKKYEECLPGSAERIIQMAEKQSAHRQALETKVINSDTWRSTAGLILGFIIAIVGLGVTCLLGIYGSVVAASLMGIGTLGTLVSAFVFGKKTREDKLEQNQ